MGLFKFLIILIVLFCSNFLLLSQQTYQNSSPDKYYYEALEHFRNKQYALAEQFFDNFLAIQPTSKPSSLLIDAEYYSAICDLYLYHSNAETRISEFSKTYPLHPKALKANYDLALFYYNDKKYEKATAFFEKVAQNNLDKNDIIEYKFKLGYCYMMEKNFSKAILFNDIKNLESPYKDVSTYYAAFVNFKNGDYANAELDVKKLVDNKNFAENVPSLYMNILCKQKKYQEAINYIEALELKGGKFKQADEVNMLAADAYFYLNEYQKAVYKFEKVSNIKMGLPDTLFKYGYALYDLGQYAKSIEILKNISSKNLTAQFGAYYQGLAYLKLNNNQFALNAFNNAIDFGFDTTHIKPMSMFLQGKILFDLRSFDESITSLRKYLIAFPNHNNVDEANSLLSEAFLNSSNYKEAIKYIENLNKKTDRALGAYQKVTFYQAMEFYNDNKIDLAMEFLDKSLEHQINSSFTQMAYFWKGEGMSVLKMLDEAIEAYLAMPKVESNYTVKSLYGIAYAYYFQKKYDKAFKYFDEYVKKVSKDNVNKRNYIDGLVRIADCKYISKQYNEALNYYDKALSENPLSDVDYILFQKGTVMEILEKYQEANENYELVIRRFPHSVYYDNCIFQKGNILFVKNDFENTTKLMTQLIEHRSDSKLVPTSLLLRGKSNKNLEKIELSISDFKRIIADYPSSEVVKAAILELQDAYERNNQEAEFEQVINQFTAQNPAHTDLEKIQYQTAFNAYTSRKYDFAIVKFKSFIEKFPNSTYINNIEYYLGYAYEQKGDTNNSSIYYNLVIDKNKSDYGIDAVNSLAKIELNKGNLDKSNKLYLRLLGMSVNQIEILNAQVGLMENYFKSQKFDSSIVYGRQILNSGSKNATLINKTGVLLGKSFLGVKDTSGALTQFMEMLNNTQDEYGAEANFLAAEIFYRKGQYKQSIDKIYYLREKYKNYKEWLQKSFFLMVDDYLALNEVFQAKGSLNSVISKSKDKVFVEKAKLKLAYVEENYKSDEESEDDE